ncbi:zonular occludens toxin domain-containing protein [Vallitalea guaymasensis]|uniref:zonular occludens toxin domain-containing protein n=1 Tax=Vallitalea guaymasensis TaxID=1185412 RepID=UPI000DE2FA29|nr:zonular occludens toxin domain-containing protein [Vallitalea guaymasensis]
MKGILGSVINLLLVILVILLLVLLTYILIKVIKMLFRLRRYKKFRKIKGFKRSLKIFSWIVLKTRFWKPLDFVKWILYDITHGKDYLRMFGIWAFTGYYGEGKTLGAVTFAKNIQKKYPYHNFQIASNTDVSGQIMKITRWEDILTLPQNTIVIFDESQNDFSSNMRDFPEDLLRRITQCRKRKLTLFMTSPKYTRMNINLRESVNFIAECKNVMSMDRWFTYKFYRTEDYEQYYDNKKKLRRNIYLKFSFIATNDNYRAYNTIKEVESVKTSDEDVKKVKASPTTVKRMRNEYMKYIEILEKRIEKLET